MIKFHITILLLIVSAGALAQVKPNNFVEELNPTNDNFEVYSQKGGVNRRASLLNLKRYFVQTFTNVAYIPTPSGNSSNRMQFVVDPQGDVWYIDASGNALKLSAAPGVFTAGPLTGSGTSLLPVNVLSNSINDTYIQQGSIDSTEIQAAGIALENISRDGANTGQVIRWNGTAWVAAGLNNYDLVTTSQTVSASTNQVFIDTLTASVTLNLAPCNQANNGVKFEFVKMGPDNYSAIIEPSGVEAFVDGSPNKVLYSRGTTLTCTCRWTVSGGKWLYSIW